MDDAILKGLERLNTKLMNDFLLSVYKDDDAFNAFSKKYHDRYLHFSGSTDVDNKAIELHYENIMTQITILKDLKQLTQKPQKQQTIMITISPRPDITVEQLISVVKKVCCKTFITQSHYVIEQRGKNLQEMGSGIHAHIVSVLNKYKKKSHLIKEIFNTCKGIVQTQQHVDIQINDKPDGFMKYIKGEKGDLKKDNVEITDKWRQQLNLQPIYCVSNEKE